MTTTAIATREVPVGGTLHIGTQTIDVMNPWDDSLVGRVPSCGPAELQLGLDHAAALLENDAFPQHERAAVLDRAAQLVAERSAKIARVLCLEAGKPITQARGEVSRCIDTLTLCASETRQLSGETVPTGATAAGSGRLGIAVRRPIGIIAAITPFNFPLNMVTHKVGPAIAAGCPVILKPASATPLSALELIDVLYEAGMPAGWVSVLPGPGATLGEALATADSIAMVTFTGSSDVGWHLAARSPRKKVTLELGSTAPLIVGPDADLAHVAQRLRLGGFSHAGQSCISTQRVLVSAERFDESVETFEKMAASLVVGDPCDETTEVGPLINANEAERVERWITEAVDGGATVRVGGERSGAAVSPCVVVEPDRSAAVWRDEVFGPLITVNGYRNLDHAIEQANDSRFGLQAGIFTNDLSAVLTAARRLNFGGLVVNDVPTTRLDQQPYGGVKDSGNTREGPRYTIHEMTDLMFINLG
jgi:acyl-CoA reductase-like NAD-dependent aldehyde dehydrogenase